METLEVRKYNILIGIEAAKRMNASAAINVRELSPKVMEETLRMNNKFLTKVSKFIADN